MLKNERYVKISTHVGLTTVHPSFATVRCSAFSSITGRVDYTESILNLYLSPRMRIHKRNSLELATVPTITGNNMSNCRGRKKIHGT
jgi:hypothetical protein